MLVNAIYNVIDRIFIGQFVGEETHAGLTISFPVMLMIFAFASLIGVPYYQSTARGKTSIVLGMLR